LFQKRLSEKGREPYKMGKVVRINAVVVQEFPKVGRGSGLVDLLKNDLPTESQKEGERKRKSWGQHANNSIYVYGKEGDFCLLLGVRGGGGVARNWSPSKAYKKPLIEVHIHVGGSYRKIRKAWAWTFTGRKEFCSITAVLNKQRSSVVVKGGGKQVQLKLGARERCTLLGATSW